MRLLSCSGGMSEDHIMGNARTPEEDMAQNG